jgi:hypothetical protein
MNAPSIASLPKQMTEEDKQLCLQECMLRELVEIVSGFPLYSYRGCIYNLIYLAHIPRNEYPHRRHGASSTSTWRAALLCW